MKETASLERSKHFLKEYVFSWPWVTGEQDGLRSLTPRRVQPEAPCYALVTVVKIVL